jgi:alpha-D-xyloside xylohydrolase
MKFDEGQWRLLPGTLGVYPVSVVEVRTEPDALVVAGYSQRVQVRNDYLGGTTIMARFTSPLPNVIRVQLTHFKGRRESLPVFDLDYALTNAAAEIGRDDHRAWLKAGDLSVVVPTQGEWRFAFQRGGENLTESEPKAVGLFTQNDETYLRDQLSLQVGETVYGLGEHFGPFVKNGQSVDSWNMDGGTPELATRPPFI